MEILVSILHVTVCLILIMVVLLQSGKGADLASAFGGGSSQTTFGPRGAASVLSRITTIAAVMFMLTSLILYLYGSRPAPSVVKDLPSSSAPAKNTK